MSLPRVIATSTFAHYRPIRVDFSESGVRMARRQRGLLHD
jgi:hypothetical protein